MPELDFDGHDTLYATHGLHAFAAKCPPQLAHYGLRYYSKPGETVLDPMAGSGTTLVEARLRGRHALGYDIDPLARLVARVKSRTVSDGHVARAHEVVAARAAQDLAAFRAANPSAEVRRRATPPDFHNRDYWFSPDVSASLAILSYHINYTPMAAVVRDFLWTAFSSLILARTSVANARDIIHSRHHHWKHDQPPDVLCKFDARVRRMRKQAGDFLTLCAASNSKVDLGRGDARDLPLNDETVDLVFTSPPYATALDYTRAHFLAVAWMQKALGVSLEDYLAKGLAYIGSGRGKLPREFAPDDSLNGLELTQSVITRLVANSPAQAKRTQRYFTDMYQVLREIARVLRSRRHAVIVICPSHIRKVEIPTHEAFVEMGREHGLGLKKKYTRTISLSRRVLPYMQESFGKRMDTEYVLIFQKTS